ncbi:hypothetical protein L208DRAFT_1344229, partial [Tricholoma matsutake]
RWLQRINSTVFAWGRHTGIQSILDHLLATTHPITSSSLHCPNNHPLDRGDSLASSCQISILCQCPTIWTFIDDQSIECASCCRICQSLIICRHVFEEAPPIIAFDLARHQTSLLENLIVTAVNGHCTTYKLRGVMYYLDDHFTSCIITESGHVWYHDGISTGCQMENEGSITNMISNLGTCRSWIATCAVYVIASIHS